MSATTIDYAAPKNLLVWAKLKSRFFKFRRNRNEERVRFQIYFQTYDTLSRLGADALAANGISNLEIADIAFRTAYGDRQRA